MLSFREDLAAHRASTGLTSPQMPLGVNTSLTPGRSRPRRHRENGDYGAMVLRVIHAYGRRVAVADPEDLEPMYACYTALGDVLRSTIRAARAAGERPGWTWERVGLACGAVSKQAAQARWGRTSA